MHTSVIPAILRPSLEDITEAVDRVSSVASYVQIDVVDGFYAPQCTWPYPLSGDLATFAQRLDNLRVSYELDLMIEKPEETLSVWLLTSVRRVIVHAGSTNRLAACVSMIKEAGREVYVALSIADDPAASLSPVLADLDGVQCMGIAQIGVQGEPYDDHVERVIRSVKELKPSLPVTVDGGVSLIHVPALRAAGVSQIAVGSALFSGDAEENFIRLSEAMLN